MDDDVSEIDQDPVPVSIALYARDAQSGLLGFFGDCVGNRSGLDLGSSGDDDEFVRDNRPAGNVDFREIFALFVECGSAHNLKNFRQWIPPKSSGPQRSAARWAVASQ